MASVRISKTAMVAAVNMAFFATALTTTSAFAQASDSGRQGGGYGYGYGMMGGGLGPGMMGGGPGIMGGGPGMMGGGPGMMGGGPGMMGFGVGWGDALGLTDEQRTKINRIQDDTRHAHWALMNGIMDQQAKLRDLYEAPTRDAAAIDSTYQAIGDLRQKMIDSSRDARKRMEAVLTNKQREKLRTYREQDGWSW